MALLVLIAYVGTLLFKLVRHIDFPGTELHLTGGSVFGTIVTNLFFFLAMGGILMILYKFVPTIKVKWHHVLLPGAVTAAILVIVNALLGWYIRHLGYYNVVYGSLASVIVLLVWTYICANILIGGAAMSAAMADLEQRANGTDAAVDSKHPNTQNQQSTPG
jgi:YihY family inner membrane protein